MMCSTFQRLSQTGMDLYLIVRRAAVKMLEGCNDILAESWGKNILLCAELVPGLSDNGIDDVQPRNFVFGFALLTWNETQGWCEHRAFSHLTAGLWTDSTELTFWMNFSTLWTTCL